jgi:hypothetical protein
MNKTKLSIIAALFCFGVFFTEGAFAQNDPCSGLSEKNCKSNPSCTWMPAQHGMPALCA